MKIVPMSAQYCYHSGSDLSVVNAARVSFHKESEWMHLSPTEGELLHNRDKKLIYYLAKHNHWTPFAHNSITMRVKAPIFVARQMGKHQVGLVWNEVSRRYVDEEPEFWFPKEWRGRSSSAKQGSSDTVVVIPDKAFDPLNVAAVSLMSYNKMIADGIAPEQARMVLPQNTMTEWIWTGSLAAWTRICKLRLDPHTQLESQELAGVFKAVVAPLFPVSWEALMEHTQ